MSPLPPLPTPPTALLQPWTQLLDQAGLALPLECWHYLGGKWGIYCPGYWSTPCLTPFKYLLKFHFCLEGSSHHLTTRGIVKEQRMAVQPACVEPNTRHRESQWGKSGYFIYLFERREERERNINVREKYQSVAFLICPEKLQPRQVP